MTTNNLIAGLQILAPHYKNKTDYNIGATSGEIYAHPTDAPLNNIDILEMIRLGWHQEHDERDYDKDFELADYRQEESWIAYI